MCSTDAASSYLKRRKSILEKCITRGDEGIVQTYSYISIVDTEPLEANTAAICTLRKPKRLKLNAILHLFDKDIYSCVDTVLEYLINNLVHSGFAPLCKRRNVHVYRRILDKFKGKEFNSRLKWSHSARFHRKNWAFKVEKVATYKSRTQIKGYICRLIGCCLYLNECVLGIKLSKRDLIYLVNKIPRCKSIDESWNNIKILKCSEGNFALPSNSYFISNVLFADDDLFCAVLTSDAYLWQSFDPKYVKEMMASLLFFNTLNVDQNGEMRIRGFKTMLNRSFNECLYRNINTGNAECVKYLKQFYAVINVDLPLNPENHLYLCFPYNLTLKETSLEKNIQDVIFVSKSLLCTKTKSNVWIVIQLMSHYFARNTLELGYLECCYPYTCVKCTGVFSSIYCGLFDLLILLRTIEFYSSHLLLVKMLIKHELQRIKAGFWRDETCLNKSNDHTKSTFEPFLNKRHRNYGWNLQDKIREDLLLKCISYNDSVIIKQRSITQYKKCPVYLRLLSAVDHHISTVNVTCAIERLVDNNGRYIFEQITGDSCRRKDSKSIFSRELNINGPVSLMANIYIGVISLNKSLSALVIRDKLNIIERTQACLALSRNLNLVDFAFPQIVQSVSIDPGNRVFNLINAALNHKNIKSVVYYYLASLVHSNINPYVKKKASLLLSFIFNKLPEDSKTVHEDQILFHGKLLALSRTLCGIPASKRPEELSKHIKNTSESIRNGLNLCLFQDILLPKDTDRSITGINEDSVKILKSATRSPFLLPFKNKTGQEISYIYKMRDDLRQDNLVVQLKSFMLKVFAEHKLDIFLQPFLILPYSSILEYMFSRKKENGRISPELPNDVPLDIGGIVGVIPNTVSRHQVGKDQFTSLTHFFLHKFGDRNSLSFSRAIENFIKSLAGYSLLSFLLQVKDRHNGNLLLSDKGHIIHIDFGFILGTSPAADVQFEQAPFKLTKEMIDLLGGINSMNFKRFANLLVNAYLAIRAHADTFITLVELMQHSTITCFRNTTLAKLRRRLRLHCTPQEAKDFVIRKIYAALNSKTTVLYDVVQSYQQGIER